MKQNYPFLLSLLLFLFLAGNSKAVTYFSRTSGNWNNSGSWSTTACGNATNTGTFPVAGDIVTICSGHTINVNVNSACATLTITSGTLDFPSNNAITLVTLNMDGTAAITGNNPSRIVNVANFNVSAGATASISGQHYNITGNAQIDGRLNIDPNTSGDKVIAGNLTIGNNGSVNFRVNETLTVNGNLIMGNSTSIGSDNGSNGVLTVAGNFIVNAGGSADIGRGDFTFNLATQINGTLNFSASATGNKTFNGPITIASTGTFNNSIGEDPRINGNITNDGSWIGCTGGTCTYTFGTIAGTYTISGNAVVMSNVSINAGTTVINTGVVIIDRNANNVLTGNGTFTNSTNGILYVNSVAATPINITTFNATAAGNTVIFNGAGNQGIRIPSDGGYYNLTTTTSGTKTFQSNGTIGVSNLLTIEQNSIFDVNTNTLNGAGGLTMTDNSELWFSKCTTTLPELSGSYSLTGGIIKLRGNCAQTLRPGKTYYSLQLGDAGVGGAKTITGITAINGDLTVTGSATISGNSGFVMDCSKNFIYSSTGSTTLTAAQNLTIGNFSQLNAGTLIDNAINITVCGSSFDRAAGTFTSTGTATFNGNTTVSGASTTTFNNVIVNNTKTLVGHATNMNVKANWQNDGTYTHNSGTVTFTGTTTVSGANSTTFNNVTISSTLTGHVSDIYVEGTWTNNGTFNNNNGTITFLAGNAQSLAGTNTSTFYNLTINKSSGTTLTQTVATATVTNLLSLTEGIFSVGANTLNGTGGFTATGGDLQLGKAGTVPELSGTYSITGGIVTLNRAGTQTLNTSVTGADTYYNLVFTNSGAKTITGLLFINGDATVSGSSTITANSAFVQASDKSFTYSSSGSTTMTAATTITVGSYFQTLGTFNINNNNMIVIGATWNKSAGTFTANGRVFFNGNILQTFFHNSGNLARATIDNSNGVLLNTSMSLVTDLTFTSGNIVTGSNAVILTGTGTTVTGASQGTGYVDGNFQKNIAATSARTFEIGSSGIYAPINFTFTGVTAGNLLCYTTSGDSPDIFASDVDPNKSVNRYWSMVPVSIAIGAGSYSATFNYPVSDVDVVADASGFGAQNYDGTTWNNLTISGVPTTTSTTISGVTTFTTDFVIGEKFNPFGLYNAVTGAMNWNNAANWIRYRTGTINATSGDVTITGVGSKFLTEFSPGDIVLLQNDPSSPLGTVQSVTNDGELVLVAGATATIAGGSIGVQAIPNSNDQVNIGNPFIPLASVTVDLDMSSTIYKLIFTRMNVSNTLNHSGANSLTITNNVDLKQPNTANTNSWNINGGLANVGGNITIGSLDAGAGKISRVNLTTGTLTVGTNLIFSTATAANAVLDLSGGACNLVLSGNFTLTNTANNFGTFTPGTTSTVNYNRTISGQTVNLTTAAPAVTYANLHLNNTSVTGVNITTNITNTRVTGNIRVQTGKFYYGTTISVVGNAGKTFEVANGATFEMSGTSAAFPTVFTFLFGPTSNTYFLRTNAINPFPIVASPGYGNLFIQPAGTQTHRLSNTNYYVQGNLTLGNGTNTTTLNAASNTATLNVTGDIIINSNATLDANTQQLDINIGGNWTNSGGTFTPGTRTVTFNGIVDQQINGTPSAQTFYNLTVTKLAGTTLSAGGSTTTLNTNNVTVNSGNFTAPATLNLNSTGTSSMILAGGTFTAGSLITLRGNWTNNGGTFVPNAGLVRFEQGTNPQNINGTAVSQTFYNVEIYKNAGSVIPIAPLATLNVNNFTISDFHSNVSALTTFNVNGNFTVNPASGTGTFTPNNNINIGGNILYSNGSLTWGTNVTLNGSTQQSIGGTSTYPNFTNLIINNSLPFSGIKLNAPISVNGALTLTDGHILTDATNILKLTDNGTVVLNAPVTQDSSFVRGPMAYEEDDNGAASTKVFPVGKANELHRIELNVTHSSTGTNTYTAEYYLSSEAPFAVTSTWTLPGTVDNRSGIGHWDLSKSGTAGISNGSVKLYYLDSDSVTDEANLCIIKGNPSAWTDIGGTGTSSPSGTITSTTNFTTFSRFSLGNKIPGTNPLPVELLSFNAVKKDKLVELSWVTSSEINNAYFMIDRSSNGIDFEYLLRVDGAGNSNVINKYQANDDNPLNGVSYYRLIQVDYNGKETNHGIKAVQFDSEVRLIAVFPNPVVDERINISLAGYKNQEVLVVMMDVLGKEVFTKVIVVENDEHSFAIVKNNDLPKGTYIVTASSKDQLVSKRIIIQ